LDFALSPHVKSILCGRGMCKDGKLLCSATNCIFHPKDQPDPDFGRAIEVKGYGICSRCEVKTDWEERKWSDRLQHDILHCKACRKFISRKSITWTQQVKSKHHRHSHEYYHMECWDAMFIELPDDDDSACYCGSSEDFLIIRLIRWALKA